MFSELVFVVWYDQFVHLLSDAMFFGTLRAMYEVRRFNLGLLVQVPHPTSRERRERFELALAAVTDKGLLDFLDSPPTVRLVQPYPLVHPYP